MSAPSGPRNRLLVLKYIQATHHSFLIFKDSIIKNGQQLHLGCVHQGSCNAKEFACDTSFMPNF